MHPAMVGLILVAQSGSVLETMDAYRALDVPGKVRARQVYRELMGTGGPPPASPAPAAVELRAHLKRRIRSLERQRAAETPPPLLPRPRIPPPPGSPSDWTPEVLDDTAYRYRRGGGPLPPAPPGPSDQERGVPPGPHFPERMWARTGPGSKVPTPPLPEEPPRLSPSPDRSAPTAHLPGLDPGAGSDSSALLGIVRGGVRHRQPKRATWEDLYAGKPNPIAAGSMLQTREQSEAWVALPRGGGRIDMGPETSLEVNDHGVRLVRGEIRIRVPAGASRHLLVETPRGRLRIGPGGEARVRPKGFASIEGPVERAG